MSEQADVLNGLPLPVVGEHIAFREGYMPRDFWIWGTVTEIIPPAQTMQEYHIATVRRCDGRSLLDSWVSLIPDDEEKLWRRDYTHPAIEDRAPSVTEPLSPSSAPGGTEPPAPLPENADA